jgi:hypothetical protein
MGQYHILANLDKDEIVHPHGLGLGLKQYEHTGCEGSLADAMYLLVMTSPARGGGDWRETALAGSWVGDRVVILGDYTEDSDLPPELNGGTLYEYLTSNGKDITADVATALGTVWNFTVEGDGWATRRVANSESTV